jgi:type IV secretory pathway VirJ component
VKAFGLLILLLLASVSAFADIKTDSVSFGRFGVVHTYRAVEHPRSVVLFVSGDGGWNLGVVDMARALTSLDALVVGINITNYLKALDGSSDKCSYPAADFEALGQFIQQHYLFADYITPILVGYSSGATLVYAVIVQAPTNTFQGAMSLGFCPDLPLTKVLCRGNGLEWTAGPKGKGFNFLPAPKLEIPWFAFQGLIDQVCDPKVVKEYAGKTSRAKIIELPKVGHGFSVQANWMPQFKAAFKELISLHTEQRARPVSVGSAPIPDFVRASHLDSVLDLPLVVVDPVGNTADYFAVIVTGDGGWSSIDRLIGNDLADKGVPVVGLNSLKYFWTRRTPDEASADLGRIIAYFQSVWKKKSVVLIGYSRGADVLPFMANRLPANLLDDVRLIALLGPEALIDFKLHVLDLVSNQKHDEDLRVLPEVEKLKGKQILCFYGADETESLCAKVDTSQVKIVQLPGGHHFGNDYAPITKAIVEAARLK